MQLGGLLELTCIAAVAAVAISVNCRRRFVNLSSAIELSDVRSIVPVTTVETRPHYDHRRVIARYSMRDEHPV